MRHQTFLNLACVAKLALQVGIARLGLLELSLQTLHFRLKLVLKALLLLLMLLL
jgi:hypothetical protein